MKLTRLRIFDTQCSQDLQEEGAASSTTFYLHKDAWWDLTSTRVTNTETIEDLNGALYSGIPVKRPASKDTFFPIAEANAVVRATFKASLKEATRQQMQRVVARSFKDASNAFEVEFNQLTGLLGKKATLQWLRGALNSSLASVDSAEEASGSATAGTAICVIAIDIDHFKQVNDHFGHSYGDLVLRAFGLRLEKVVEEFRRARPGLREAVACHASGEEFFCLAVGEVETETFLELAEAIRLSISSEALPDEDQLRVLLEGVPANSVTVPPTRQRNISCSLGLVVQGPTTPEIAETLLKQADLALYRSKTLGRNRHVAFGTILEQCGRVLEHRTDVGIITIDIGGEVGVAKGQEFLVFHPDFTGSVPFTVDDGRSKRVLGTYPRLPLARITTLDVQQQLAFCRRSDSSEMAIPPGALLEAIPLGSISHLFAADAVARHLGLDEWLRPGTESKKFFSQSLDADSKTEILVLRIHNQASLMEKRGADLVNRVLAAGVEALRSCCPKAKFAGSIEQTEIALAVDGSDSFDMGRISTEIEQTSATFGWLPVFSVGVFRPFATGGKKKWAPEGYEARLALARFAATYPIDGERNSVALFDTKTAVRALRASRSARTPARGLADFDRFTKMGLVAPPILNNAGLLCSESGDLVKAEQHYALAHQLDPESDVYRRNLLVVRSKLTNYRSEQPLFDAKEMSSLFEQPSAHPGAVVAIASTLIEQLKSAAAHEQIEIAKQWAAKGEPFASEAVKAKWSEAIETALRRLEA